MNPSVAISRAENNRQPTPMEGIEGSRISAPWLFNAMSNLRRPFPSFLWLCETAAAVPPLTRIGGYPPLLFFSERDFDPDCVLRGLRSRFSRSISARVGLDFDIS